MTTCATKPQTKSNRAYNEPCSECGHIIRIAIARKGGLFICSECFSPRSPSCSSGGTGHGHWDDDPSGASGSWDNAVKLQEDHS